MRIECPSCQANYDVPDDRLAPGRPVRCARCGTNWTPVPAPEPRPPASTGPEPAGPSPTGVEATPPEAVQPEPSRSEPEPPPPAPSPSPDPQQPPDPAAPTPDTPAPPDPESATPPTRRIGKAVLPTAWVLSVALVAALAWAAIAYRMPIAQAWPPSTRAYKALNLIP